VKEQKMKRIVWVIPLILGIIFIAACTTPPSADNQATVQTMVENTLAQQPSDAPPAATETLPPVAPTENVPQPMLESFEVVLLPNAQDEQMTDVLLRNAQTGAKTPLFTLDQVYREHYHAAEFNNQYLFIIKRIGDVNSADGNWTDELWRYEQQDSGEKLFSGKGLDFRVSPDGQMIALQYADGLNLKIVFLKPPSEVVREFDLSQLNDTGAYYPDLETWNAQSDQFWGALQTGPKIMSYFRIDTNTWEITNFDVSTLPINSSRECALNGNTGKLAFSDYPAIFDAASHQEFVDSQKPVNLFVFDLNSQATQTISTSQAKEFQPVWLNDKTVEFNDPNSNVRTIFTLP
jgi:hypothetical protein